MNLFDLLKPKKQANEEQLRALELLKNTQHTFLTGAAGTGKSFVIGEFLKSTPHDVPLLSSTGASALLIGGRTFHSFFGLGIMEGGISATIDRALKNPRVGRRLRKAKALIIDEVSMIHPAAFMCAHRISQLAREDKSPFGGLKLILVGDFFQLPPIDRFSRETSFLFEDPIWGELDLQSIELKETMRTDNQAFIQRLHEIRKGQVTEEGTAFLNSRVKKLDDRFRGAVLFGRRVNTEKYNQDRLANISQPTVEIKTDVHFAPHIKEPPKNLFNLSPVPEVLVLKKGALVMIRKNDLEGEYVNGSLGTVESVSKTEIKIELLSGRSITLEKEDFQILDGDGKEVCRLTNFPITLGWATTIHKAQGASIDSLFINIKDLWDYGQAYVALSRAKDPEFLFIEDWNRLSIKAHPKVLRYYGTI